VEQQEPTEGQIHRYGESQLLSGLGDGENLGERRGSGSDSISGGRVDVNCEDAPRCSNDFGECDRDLAAAGTDISAGPALAEIDALERSGEGSPVDVVSKSKWCRHAPSLPWSPRWSG